MSRKLFFKLKQNKAFTMTEMLLVVAITVVLLGISIMAISGIVTNLKMTELDDHAKVIYLEAQNQLSVIEVEGALDTYHDDIRDAYPADGAKKDLRFLKDIYGADEKPSDYPDEAGSKWEQMCYLTKSDDLCSKLISHTSDIYNNCGSYLIEFNAQTGDIYGVFYWESDEEITYEHVLNLRSRQRNDRTNDKIGYYGGSVAGDLTNDTELGQMAKLIIGEELYLRVSFEKTAELVQFYNTSLKVSVTITGEKGNSVTFDQIDLSNMTETLDTLEFYMLLDSMYEGYSFDDIVNAGLIDENKIVPGENITITVNSFFDYGTGCWDKTESVKGNSLFGYGTSDSTICITSLRNMMNLNEAYYDADAFGRDKIKFISDVDFDEEAYSWDLNALGKPYYVGYGNAKRPMDNMTPIKNVELFLNSDIDGGQHALHNFKILATESNVGIFARTENVDLADIYVKDITVNATGYDNVGALVGYMKGGSISKCGVYLSTTGVVNGLKTDYCNVEDESESGCNHSDEMQHRYESLKINGNNNVGGLVGCVEGVSSSETHMDQVFAAIKVEGAGLKVGGLIGYVNNTEGNGKLTIQKSYASGDIVGTKYTGGFAGSVSANANNVIIKDNYATGDVYADLYFGGFLGQSKNTSYENCISYGEVFKASVLAGGTDSLKEEDCVGGFVYTEQSVGDTYTNCVYMIQNGYNTEDALKDPEVGMVQKNYKDLLAGNGGMMVSSYPYAKDLHKCTFPFKSLDGQTTHYGDWPLPFVIDTSLVYYERYKDSSYGYYCVTAISDKNDIWVLNTLKDEICVEDGYGILTKYNLESIDYDLYVGNEDDTPTISKKDVGVITKDSVDAGGACEGKFIGFNQLSDLSFYAVEDYDHMTGAEGTKTGESFETSNLYFYQLPYELQCTDRTDVSYFYDRIVFSATANGSNTKVINGLSYLYCPHFAKTAVNIYDDNGEYNNPVNVFVRSARQLNALGRYPYYWNARNGLATPGDMVFVQETDINFSTYVKTYLGQAFNLQAFGEDYSNRPIGEATYTDEMQQHLSEAEKVAKHFKNTYDGQSNKIIDYCVDGGTKTQYVGLFGAISGATLKNIVMLVSSEPTGNGGLITSQYETKHIYDNDQNFNCVGIGALVGLAYDQTNGTNIIENCVASGYTVKYQLLDKDYLQESIGEETIVPQGGAMEPLAIVIGGLAGFSTSDMSNCAAVNDIVLELKKDYHHSYDNYVRDGNFTGGVAYLGGFVGSFGYGKVENCYSGGTIEVINKESKNGENYNYSIPKLRVGGFCPGWLDALVGGERYTDNDKKLEYSDIYSYTKVSKNIWDVPGKIAWDEENDVFTGTVTENFTHYIPLVSSLVDYYDTSDVINELWIHDQSISADKAIFNNNFYLTEVTSTHMGKVLGDSNNLPEKFYMEDGVNIVADEIISEQLRTYANDNGLTVTVSGDNTHTYVNGDLGDDGKLISSSEAYPYPAVIYEVDEAGNKTYVHYGSWLIVPTEDSPIVRYPVYFEEHTEGYRFLYVDENGTTHSDLTTVNTTAIMSTGYGYLTMFQEEANVADVSIEIEDPQNRKITYYLCKMDQTKLEAASVSAGRESYRYMTFEMQYSRGELEAEPGVELLLETKTLCFNPYYGAALSAMDESDESNNIGSLTNPLQVRTKEQFENITHTSAETTYVKQTHNIDLKGGHTSATVSGLIQYDGSSEDEGCVISNATDTLFQKNNGLIKNTKVVSFDSTAQSKDTIAGFVLVNYGTIEKCSVAATNNQDKVVIQGKEASGFVSVNYEAGLITGCYVVGSIIGTENDAYGFVGTNNGRVCNSYVGDKTSDEGILVQGNNAYGFAGSNNIDNALIDSCYVVGDVIGTESDAYGFIGPNKGRVTNSCVGDKDSHINVLVQGNNAYGFAASNIIDRSVIDNCYAAGKVIGTVDVAAGFIGLNNGVISNSTVYVYNNDTQAVIEGNNAYGFGETNNNKIEKCSVIGKTDGTVTGTTMAVGFAGINNATIIESFVCAMSGYEDVVIKGADAYGFIGTNNGTSQYNYAVGTVEATRWAAGFVGRNNASITNCYANAIVSASKTNTEAKATGFAFIASSSISSCYACGDLSAYATYGFLWNGSASNCYTIVNQDGTNMYGFAPKGVSVSGCYWGYDAFKNHNIPAAKANVGVGTRVTLAQMDNAATDTTVGVQFSDKLKGESYLYETFGRTHYGDWPLASHFHTDVDADDLLRAGVYYTEEYYDYFNEKIVYGTYAEGDYYDSQNKRRVIGTTVNTLMKGKAEHIEKLDCYFGVYYNRDISAPAWNVKWVVDGQVTETIFRNLTEGRIPDEFPTYLFYKIGKTQPTVTIWYKTNTNNGQNTDTAYENLVDESGNKIDITNGVEIIVTLEEVEAARNKN